MDFYAVLPSNASPDIYSNNKTSNFKVQLCERMDLHGDWQVALLEIQYPNTLSHVLKTENWIEFQDTSKDLKERYYIRPGNYVKNVDLISELNDTLLQPRVTQQSLQHPTPVDLPVLKISSDGVINIYPFEDFRVDKEYSFSPSLALQLGLPHSGPYPCSNELTGIRPVDMTLGVPSQMYIYLNIIQDQIVGHTRAPLLRTVPTVIDGKYGTMTTFRCEHPVYFDLNTKSFDNVEVNIRNDTGAFLPFHHGTLTLLVHFKQRV